MAEAVTDAKGGTPSALKVRIHRGGPNPAVSGIMPSRGTRDSAGLDLHVPIGTERIMIAPGGTARVDAMISMEIPEGTYGRIEARSSHGSRGIVILGGIVDSGYRGRIAVMLANVSDEAFVLEAGERMAQMMIIPYVFLEPIGVESLEGSERGSGGFGSTGR